jgi:hypothetical protein
MIKGTNLAGNVSLTLSGADAAKFTLTKSSLTAAEVNAGQVIILKYKPEAIKAHTATLTVSSNDFASVVVPITGECTFQALEATNVGSSGFTANWTNAGAANYVLDVSTQTTVGGASVPVLTEQFNGSMSTSVSISGFSILTELNSTAIRIGASGTAATMTLTGLDLSHGASIALSAKMYSAIVAAVPLAPIRIAVLFNSVNILKPEIETLVDIEPLNCSVRTGTEAPPTVVCVDTSNT